MSGYMSGALDMLVDIFLKRMSKVYYNGEQENQPI
jgi:hypothetical protein